MKAALRMPVCMRSYSRASPSAPRRRAPPPSPELPLPPALWGSRPRSPPRSQPRALSSPGLVGSGLYGQTVDHDVHSAHGAPIGVLSMGSGERRFDSPRRCSTTFGCGSRFVMHSVAARRTSSWSENCRYSSARTPPFSLVMRFFVASSTLAKFVSPSNASKCISSSAWWSFSRRMSGGMASSRWASVSTLGFVVTRILPRHHAASRTHLTEAFGELAKSEQTRNAPCCTMLPRTGTSTAICRSAMATCS
mmetsp:Transcript_61215/g.167877  ORF Transcript_61215/g.167877 Transcript_61215/m.167877 type:complete len:250 (+) Transcript_61215:412-1161(+)